MIKYNLKCKKEGRKQDHLSDTEIVDLAIQIWAPVAAVGLLQQFVLYHLSIYPEVADKVRAEIEELSIKKASDYSLGTLNNLTYLDAVIRETIRIYSIAPELLFREALEDHQLGGLNIRKGTLLHCPAQVLGNRPEIPDADQFRPERFLNGELKTLKGLYVIPFGAGPRNCPGEHLTMTLNKIMACEWVKNFDLRVKSDFKMTVFAKFALKPQKVIPFVFEPRDPTSFVEAK